MTEAEMAERLTRLEDRAKSNTHRIDELKPIIEEIHTISKTMVELIGEVKHTNDTVREVKDDICRITEQVDAMEKEPAKAWKSVKKKAIDTVIGVIVGAMAAGAAVWIAQYI